MDADGANPDGMTIAGYRIGWTASIRSARPTIKDRRRRRYGGIRRRVGSHEIAMGYQRPRSQDPRRVVPTVRRILPFHDVQMMVAGQAASALGDLFRRRWQVVTRRRLPIPARRSVEDLWPRTVEPDLQQCSVGLMRTQPGFAGQAEVRRD